MAPNRCPCGDLGDPRHDCRCTPPLIERYRSRISGPLLDRIDLHVEVPAISLQELKGPPSEASVVIAERVWEARLVQRRRFGESCPTPTYAAMDPEQLRSHSKLDPPARRLLDSAFERLKLSARATSQSRFNIAAWTGAWSAFDAVLIPRTSGTFVLVAFEVALQCVEGAERHKRPCFGVRGFSQSKLCRTTLSHLYRYREQSQAEMGGAAGRLAARLRNAALTKSERLRQASEKLLLILTLAKRNDGIPF